MIDKLTELTEMHKEGKHTKCMAQFTIDLGCIYQDVFGTAGVHNFINEVTNRKVKVTLLTSLILQDIVNVMYNEDTVYFDKYFLDSDAGKDTLLKVVFPDSDVTYSNCHREYLRILEVGGVDTAINFITAIVANRG